MWNIGIYCTQGRNISQGWRLREIFSDHAQLSGVEYRYIFHHTDEFDWSVSRAYVIYIYVITGMGYVLIDPLWYNYMLLLMGYVLLDPLWYMLLLAWGMCY